jgi:hypothetical protein
MPGIRLLAALILYPTTSRLSTICWKSAAGTRAGTTLSGAFSPSVTQWLGEVTMPMLCFHLLGPFAVLRDEQPLTAREWCSQQTRTILKVLLVRRGRAALADMS